MKLSQGKRRAVISDTVKEESTIKNEKEKPECGQQEFF